MISNTYQTVLYWVPYIVTLGLDFFWCTPLMIMGKAAEKLITSLKAKFEMLILALKN
jgi:hypothetical protein